MAGVCGRAYNASGTGLNQYVLFLAKTGTGKSAPRGVIYRFMAHAQGQLLQPMVESDAAKNTEATASPAITILCESTSETIYGQLDESLIADGLLPRFLTVT